MTWNLKYKEGDAQDYKACEVVNYQITTKQLIKAVKLCNKRNWHVLSFMKTTKYKLGK